jgi:type IV pilus assembly protein PilM
VVPDGEARYFYGGGRSEEVEDPKKAKTTLVLLVAIHSDTLAKYTDALKLAGLSPSFYEIETFSTIRSIAERGMTPVAVVDIGAATTKVYVVQMGIILSSHVISKGSQDITLALANTGHTSIAKAEEMKRDTGLLTSGNPTSESSAPISHIATLTMEYIFIEVQRALLSFEKKYNQAIGKVVLTGGGATMKGLDEFARKKLEMSIERADPFAHVQAPAFLEEVLKEAGPEFSVAVGVALRKLQEIG